MEEADRNTLPRAKPISPATVKQVIGLLRPMLDDAMPQHITTNPVAALKKRVQKATKRRARDATVEPWTYLEPDEQHGIRTSDAIPEADRLIILFALLTGLPRGEQFNLELADLRLTADAPHVVVRFGAKNQPPKNGKIRRVYLSADAVDICRRWLALLPTYAPTTPRPSSSPAPGAAASPRARPRSSAARWSPSRPAPAAGSRRSTSSTATSGVTRPVRWHDLRHSCASSLVAGWWGRRWTLEEVREHLGHTSSPRRTATPT
ncbi:site-specific integrase [Sorangium sp. So ce296]|uniref:tyrosine-type recombinase/integrase n=1 Tax=Sorangium sp. So ce296 TaxID=3133296 RepID=UPI003F62BC45